MTKASTSTRGWRRVPATTILIVWTPLVAHVRVNTTRRGCVCLRWRWSARTMHAVDPDPRRAAVAAERRDDRDAAADEGARHRRARRSRVAGRVAGPHRRGRPVPGVGRHERRAAVLDDPGGERPGLGPGAPVAGRVAGADPETVRVADRERAPDRGRRRPEAGHRAPRAAVDPPSGLVAGDGRGGVGAGRPACPGRDARAAEAGPAADARAWPCRRSVRWCRRRSGIRTVRTRPPTLPVTVAR